MFFFFIGGIQPKTITVDPTPRLCPACGLLKAQLKRIDHYISLFFIPIFPIKRGETVLVCERCGIVGGPEPFTPHGAPEPFRTTPACPNCGKRISAEFRYCPFCGRPV
jgi:hypothetical protein